MIWGILGDLGGEDTNGYQWHTATKRFVVDLSLVSSICIKKYIFTNPWMVVFFFKWDQCGCQYTTVRQKPPMGPMTFWTTPRSANNNAYRSLEVALSRELSLIEEEPGLQNRQKNLKIGNTHTHSLSSKNDGWTYEPTKASHEFIDLNLALIESIRATPKCSSTVTTRKTVDRWWRVLEFWGDSELQLIEKLSLLIKGILATAPKATPPKK